MVSISYKKNDSWENLILDAIYPVGSIYTSTNSTSPSTLFGGTWARITGQFLLAATDNGSSGASQAAGRTGGEATHTLTTSEMPSHTHTFTGSSATSGGPSNNTSGTPSNNSTGDSGSHQHGVLGWSGFQEGSGSSYTVNGSNNAQVTKTQWDGSHSHTLNNHTHSLQNHTHNLTAKGSNSNTGGGSAHNNMPPYVAVYVWKRTA